MLTFISSLPTLCSVLQGRDEFVSFLGDCLDAFTAPLWPVGHLCWALMTLPYTVNSCVASFWWAHLPPKGPFLDKIIPKEAWGCERKQIAGGGRRLEFSPNFNKALVSDTASSYSLCHYAGKTLTFRFAFFQVPFRILPHLKQGSVNKFRTVSCKAALDTDMPENSPAVS